LLHLRAFWPASSASSSSSSSPSSSLAGLLLLPLLLGLMCPQTLALVVNDGHHRHCATGLGFSLGFWVSGFGFKMTGIEETAQQVLGSSLNPNN
jgi:hypothetical protein